MPGTAEAQTDNTAPTLTQARADSGGGIGLVFSEVLDLPSPIPAALARTIQCAVTRRHSSAGANPARQLSFQPVAVGADDGGNDIG